jgi:hypothetical protein
MFELLKQFNGSLLVAAILCLLYVANECYKLNTRINKLNSEIFRNPADKRKSFDNAPTFVTILAMFFILLALIFPLKSI